MRRLILGLILAFSLAVPVCAMEFTAPEVPDSGAYIFPEEPETFSEGLWKILKSAIDLIQPSVSEAAGLCLCLIAVTLLVSLIDTVPGRTQRITQTVGALGIALLLLKPSNTLINLGAETVVELSEYGKLLLPVMTAAVAAQGGATTSAALYTGTVVFDTLLCSIVSKLIVPMIYLFLCLAAAGSAAGEDVLQKLRDFVKWLMTWCLKLVLYTFTGYMSITGVISGTVDAAAVKATKLTLSGMVPVVGSILSDASETILISAGVMKNAAGIYGLLALISVWVGPFIQIGCQYLLLKVTAAVCGVFANKNNTALIQDFSGAMGLLLAMTGTVCLLLLISTVCFMKGVG